MFHQGTTPYLYGTLYKELFPLGSFRSLAFRFIVFESFPRHFFRGWTSMISHPKQDVPKRIGELLIDANLLTPGQVQVALYDQQQFSSMRFGEIVVSRGWLKQDTVDFFGEQWNRICARGPQTSLGDYLCAAGLMDEHCIQQIIAEQARNGYRFGANAVLLGFIKQQTLDYFLQNLFPKQQQEGHYVFNGKQRIIYPQGDVEDEISWVG